MNNPIAIDLTDPTLAATLEVRYLAQTLIRLLPSHDSAIDVGAHKGDVTAALADIGFKVLAVEPQPQLAERITSRFQSLIDLDLLHLERCGASDRRGVAPFFLGSASTVNTLEQDWTRIAFPEEFKSAKQIDIPLYTIAEMARSSGFQRPAFVKIDVEGHELPALRGLLEPAVDRVIPPVVMFEANQRFPETARHCLALLRAHGYSRFDIFVREGVAPIAGERFDGAALPAAWTDCDKGSKYFYANIIAYNDDLSEDIIPADPSSFVEAYQLESARDVLRRGLQMESPSPIPVHPIWSKARSELRNYLLGEQWSDFLTHPVCRHMFFRGRWSAGQDREFAALSSTQFGRMLLQSHRDPSAGKPRLTEQLPGLSTNMLGMLYYLSRLEEQSVSAMPQRVIEVGGGYGAFAYAYLRQNPSATYTIVDLPEMLAIQHYFLTLSLPGHRIVLAENRETRCKPGEVLLTPTSLLGEQLSCDLLFSTFGFSELPRGLQRQIESHGYFGAAQIFLAGQLSSEFPGVHLVPHEEVVGATLQQFERVHVERFHTGDNYLLIGSRSAA